jgi:hypothetical protein
MKIRVQFCDVCFYLIKLFSEETSLPYNSKTSLASQTFRVDYFLFCYIFVIQKNASDKKVLMTNDMHGYYK